MGALLASMDLYNETPVTHEPRVCWVVIANPGGARIIATTAPTWEMVESFDVSSLCFPSDVMAASPVQRTMGRSATGTFTAPALGAPPADSVSEQLQTSRFIHALAARLERGVTSRAFGGLIIIAPPALLRTLETSLSLEVQRRVRQYVEADLTHLADEALQHKLSGVLAGARSMQKGRGSPAEGSSPASFDG